MLKKQPKRASVKPSANPLKPKAARVITRFRPMILSRHPSHRPMRTELPRMGFRSVIRFGSPTELQDTVARGGTRIEVNTTTAIANSASKLRMKKCFTRAGVTTPPWYLPFGGNTLRRVTGIVNGEPTTEPADLGAKGFFPIVAKHVFGSRGRGNYLLQNRADYDGFVREHGTHNYIFEQFLNYNREYRLHVTEDGCFYTCRKMLKEETPKEKRWFRNDSNSVWIVETNPQFDKPANWRAIEADCVKALKAVGLDFGACDVRVQSAKDEKTRDRTNPLFTIIEINSAPSFGDLTQQRYLEEIPKILAKKHRTLLNGNHRTEGVRARTV